MGDGSGIGECTEYTAYKAKNPGEMALKRALVALGNKANYALFWGGSLTLVDRDCKKYLAKA